MRNEKIYLPTLKRVRISNYSLFQKNIDYEFVLGLNLIIGGNGIGDSDIMMTDTINPLKSKFKGFHKIFKQDDLGLSLSSFLLN